MDKEFIKTLVAALALFVTIAASAGCISYGAGSPGAFYIVIGLANLFGWGGLVVWQFIQNLKNTRK